MSAANSRNKNHTPAEPGVWVLILGEMTVFAILFSVFIDYRGSNVNLYNNSQKVLSLNFGVMNTFLLLTSSWLVVLAIEAVRQRQAKRAQTLFGTAFICGLGFVIVKIIEYGAMLDSGINANTNEFFTFYFVLTGLHLMHVCIGLVVLIIFSIKSRQPLTTPLQIALVEGGGVYWHMVDLVWLILFPLLYLIR